MELDFSPHRSSGGTLHLLSPTHSQYGIDSLTSIKQLRRSLSRSPSRPSKFRIQNSTTPVFSNLGSSTWFRTNSTTESADLLQETRLQPRLKFSLRKNSGVKSAIPRTSPENTLRRGLSEGASAQNARISLPYRNMISGQENPQSHLEEVSEPMQFQLDDEPINFNLLRAHGDKPRSLGSSLREHVNPAKSSPLKRSDGVMNLDTPNIGSPRAKRRSINGGIFGNDFDVWDQSFDVSLSGNGSDDVPPNISLPPRSPQRRPFSLRKSTLQQRVNTASSKSTRNTSDISPFTSSLGNDNVNRVAPALTFGNSFIDNAITSYLDEKSSNQQPNRPHPLSNAISPSSSDSSLGTSTSEALPAVDDQNRSKLSFSKSLPIGALRPKWTESRGNCETPDGYQAARPLPAAFMSTGLISKKNRVMDIAPTMFGSSTTMPDTPSKKVFSTTPAHTSHVVKMSHPKHEFGSPTTPFSPHTIKSSNESFGKGVSIFGTRVANGRLSRKASFLSIEAEESPSTETDVSPIADDLPPTPTKSAQSGPRPQIKSKGNSLRSSLLGRRTSLAPDTFRKPEFNHDMSDINTMSQTDDVAMDSHPPFITFSPSETQDSPSTGRRSSRQPHVERSPSPLSHKQSGSSSNGSNTRPKSAEIKIKIATTSTSKDDSMMDIPLTPQESATPPDATKLSISGEKSKNASFTRCFPPATPTGPRDLGFSFSTSSAANGSSMLQNDVDTTLTSRFDTVHVYGIGEFSIVYRVEKSSSDIVGSYGGKSSGNTWVVKKSKKPYTGSKDRNRKMKEVQILKALRAHEHVIEIVDTWEMKNHLYIQTEFCENGNLKDFLSQTGYKARLDEFRIWKILLEISQGIKTIHDAGYIHLDLKPANIFIDWEGVLKIGDFGMASSWPAPPHLEGEGDREYIAPEVLGGRFDKPADIFALGMIMLEIAGNIVLPDNGQTWQRLRSGDMSDLPSLTFSTESTLIRDESGEPVNSSHITSESTLYDAVDDDENDLGFCSPPIVTTPRAKDLVRPPNFMADPNDEQSLERMVQRLISPDPHERPNIDGLLSCDGIQWTASRRRAGATIYEGNWGPADDVLNHSSSDIEMLDL